MAVIDVIKNIAYDTAKNIVPDTVVFGDVISVSPIVIGIDNGLKLTEEFIYKTNNIVNQNVKVNVETHGECVGNTDNEIKIGDSVILLKCFGGQKFVILGRCV